MKANSKVIVSVIVVILSLVSSYTGYRYGKSSVEKRFESDTVYVKSEPERTVAPTARSEKEVRTMKVPVNRYIHDTVCVTDTIYMPVIQKEYKTESFHAWVSGYEPSLDSIDVFHRQVVITHREKDRKWGLGAYMGYGLSKGGLYPQIGIGLTYRIF